MLSRREFIALLQAIALEKLALPELRAEAASQAAVNIRNNPSQLKELDYNVIRAVVTEMSREVRARLIEIEHKISVLSDSGLVMSVAGTQHLGVALAAVSLSEGVFGAADYDAGEIDFGMFVTVTPMVAAEIKPTVSLGFEGSVGFGKFGSFFGRSSTVGVSAGPVGASLIENDDYIGGSGGYSSGSTGGSAGVSTQSRTYGVGAKLEVSKSMSEFMDYLWSTVSGPFDDSGAPPW